MTILVNNAGGVFSSPLLETTENGWDALYKANLRHVLLCTQRVARRLVDARAARQRHQRDVDRGRAGRTGLRRVRRGQGRRHQLHARPRRSNWRRTAFASTPLPRTSR